MIHPDCAGHPHYACGTCHATMVARQRSLLRWIDAGPYHARRAIVGAVDMGATDIALDDGLIRCGRFGYTLTVRGFYRAFPDFS